LWSIAKAHGETVMTITPATGRIRTSCFLMNEFRNADGFEAFSGELHSCLPTNKLEERFLTCQEPPGVMAWKSSTRRLKSSSFIRMSSPTLWRSAGNPGPLGNTGTSSRSLLGRTWGDQTTSLKLESRFDLELIETLAAAGHEVELVAPFSDLMGHAGAVVHHPGGLMEGASDPRSDGRAAGW